MMEGIKRINIVYKDLKPVHYFSNIFSHSIYRIQFNSSAKKEAKKVKNIAKNIPKHKRGKYKQSHVTTQYKIGPQLITPTRLWAILYLALRIHNHPIHLGDMLR